MYLSQQSTLCLFKKKAFSSFTVFSIVPFCPSFCNLNSKLKVIFHIFVLSVFMLSSFLALLFESLWPLEAAEEEQSAPLSLLASKQK